ncbi:MAG: TetR/AcrR family transcriptional regulator [Rudaea sp.]|uniref:TetR/AcrR family transcriptional regulator n=1 Tax=unclassified Rudaea TaxID=2627037 RepID=UPI0010F4BA90|nr:MULTISPECIES: TetR/AcrR family transcriptional regulator [unclassified Rudaea]MBN8886483.1 TetR/AcrR family transcriptional regulator [Rudaea sp.]
MSPPTAKLRSARPDSDVAAKKAPTAPTRTRKPRQRPTQEERSAATQLVLLDATLDCMKELGYANTTLAEIEKRSRMTRGALLHHYPNKNAIIVAAFVHLYRERIKRFQTLVRTKKAGMHGAVSMIRGEMEEWFPMTLEFMSAMRTDRTLHKLFDIEIGKWTQSISTTYESLIPELDSTPSPLLVQYVIGCFLRGLCLEAIVTEKPLVDKIFDQFVEILEAYLGSL